jgi:hypothetical protein
MGALLLLAGVAVLVNRHARLAATWLAIAAKRHKNELVLPGSTRTITAVGVNFGTLKLALVPARF